MGKSVIFLISASSNVAEHGTTKEKTWVEKKMGHTPKVAGRHYEGNAAAGIAANAVVAIREAGGKNTLKQKNIQIALQKSKNIS